MPHDRRERAQISAMRKTPQIITVFLFTGGLMLQAVAAGAAPSHLGMKGGHQRNGNGRLNRSTNILNSPLVNRGIQQTVNAGSGGMSIIQNSSCNRTFYCKVRRGIYF